MVDVPVGTAKTKVFRVNGEVGRHVLVNFFLQIDAERPVRPNDDVGTNATVRRNVAVGIRNTHVRRVVDDFLPSPFESRRGNPVQESAFLDGQRPGEGSEDTEWAKQPGQNENQGGAITIFSGVYSFRHSLTPCPRTRYQ